MNDRRFDDHEMIEMERDEDRGERMTTAEMASAMNRGPEMGRASQGAPTAAQAVPARSDDESSEPLFAESESQEFRTSWERIQGGFVDDPRTAVEQADELVAAVIKRLAEVFARERNNMEQEWAKGDDVSTEDLRIALRRYRSFFDRLLSV